MKILSVKILGLLTMSMLFLVSCAGKVEEKAKETAETVKETVETAKKKVTDNKVLVLYYSETGTTEKIAGKLEEIIGGTPAVKVDKVKIEAAEAYNSEKMQEVVKKQLNEKKFPEAKPVNVNISDYDLIIIGTPTWFGEPALPLASYLQSQDFSGKKVAIFATYGGNAGEVIKNTEKYIKGATFIPGISVKAGDIQADKYLEIFKKWVLEDVLGIK